MSRPGWTWTPSSPCATDRAGGWSAQGSDQLHCPPPHVHTPPAYRGSRDEPTGSARVYGRAVSAASVAVGKDQIPLPVVETVQVGERSLRDVGRTRSASSEGMFMTGTDLTMVTSDGVRLVYDDEGEGSPVLLLHGFDGRRTDFAWQREPLLAAGHRVIALDQRCHGDSDVPLHGQRMTRLGQDVRDCSTWTRSPWSGTRWACRCRWPCSRSRARIGSDDSWPSTRARRSSTTRGGHGVYAG
jgi:hypothetical protein